MPDKSDTAGQPTLEKLAAEGVPLRKCISYEGAGEYGGNGGAVPAKAPQSLSSYASTARKSKGRY